MRWNGFSRSVWFGAAAAAAFAVFGVTLAPRIGLEWALVVFGACVVPVYLFGLAPTRRRGVSAALFAAALIGGASLLDVSPRESLLVAAIALGLGRSGIAHPGPFARSVWIELFLLFGGWSVAGLLLAGSTPSVVLAVWGFFLVQAVFFLLPRTRPTSPGAAIDAFDEARDRANAILDDTVRAR